MCNITKSYPPQTNKNFQSNFLLIPDLTQHVSCSCRNPTLSKLSRSCHCSKHSGTSEEILVCWARENSGKTDGDRATEHSERGLILCRGTLATRVMLAVSYEMLKKRLIVEKADKKSQVQDTKNTIIALYQDIHNA